MSPSFQLRDLLGLKPTDNEIVNFVNYVSSCSNIPKDAQKFSLSPYTDSVYFNYHSLGISLLFVPNGGYRPGKNATLEELDKSRLVLDGIDLYNLPFHQRKRDSVARGPDPVSSSSRSAEPLYADYPISPIVISLIPDAKDKEGTVRTRTTEKLEFTTTTTGKEFVACLGELDRKGGGGGPSHGSVDIWLEWSTDGIMLELGGDEARGPNAWDGGKDAVWKVFTLFRPKPAKE